MKSGLGPKFSTIKSLNRPVILSPDNFTPETRTPWGGFAIAKLYKNHLGQGFVPNGVPAKIGESWEFSLDPAFPSTAFEDKTPLSALLEHFAEDVFSPKKVREGQAQCHILIKLLEAAEPLSLQVHPRDQDPDLKPNECGKPESWLVLHAEKGAGIYLGFKAPLSKKNLFEILQRGEEAKNILHFKLVKPGDYFEIQPGVPHAIGPGVTVLEPQRVLPGREGKTFRLWDWGRLYGGKPRELHLEQGLKLVDPLTQVGEPFVASLQKVPKVHQGDLFEAHFYPPNDEYQTILVRGQKGAAVNLKIKDGFGVLTVLKGSLRVASSKHSEDKQTMPTGTTALVPHAALPLDGVFETSGEFVILIPSHTKLSL